ncbi:hypothetical protein LP414_27285 [Polaromonas sp. P1(28)-13]|nr:hypothetical protein LP414_27285 [Polaromonas sp. P1(28)-13]
MSTDDDAYKALIRSAKASPKPWLGVQEPPRAKPTVGTDLSSIQITNTSLEALHQMDITDQVALDAGLADLATDMTTHFSKLDDGINFCTLNGVALLTVERPGKGFSKVSHIGGEDFIPQSAYVGKRGKIIVRFKPKEAAAYEVMEMAADEAMTQMAGFSLLTEMPDGDYVTHIRLLNKEASNIREKESVKDKFVEYEAIGFGTF